MGEPRLKDPDEWQVPQLILAMQIIVIYCFCVAALVWIVLKYQVSFAPGLPDTVYWLSLVRFIYYVLPVFLAVIFGLVIRPFWPNFRNLLIGIIVLQLLYGFFASLYRLGYLQLYGNEIHQSRKARVRLMSTQHELADKNHDGQIDYLFLSGRLDIEDLPAGDYQIYATISQKGQSFPDGLMGVSPVKITKPETKPIKVNFQKDPRVFEPYYNRGEFEFNIGVKKIVPLNMKAHKVLSITRWAPYFRTTSWDGYDPDINEEKLEIDYLAGVDRFAIMPLKIPRPPIKLTEPIMDYGRDDDGNGRFERIVLILSLESSYDGPIFFQALIGGEKDLLLTEHAVVVGDNRLEIPIKAERFARLMINGPYELTDVKIFNKNPECTEGECLKRIKPFFTVPLNNYLTQAYKLNQIE